MKKFGIRDLGFGILARKTGLKPLTTFCILCCAFFLCTMLVNNTSAETKLMGNVHVDFLRIPIGAPTAGYGQSAVADDPKSPYAQDFPATRGIHTRLRIKAVVLDDGQDRVYVINLDAIGSVDFLVQKIVKKVKELTNGNLDLKNNIIITATHTHAGPGRVTPHPLWSLAADKFSQEILNMFVDQISNVILKVNEKLEPVKLGIGKGENADIINDRRCENPELKDPTMWVIRIDKIDGNPLAAIINFNMHGTVLGGDNHYFCVDAPGLIEEKFEERFNNPITAMLIQSSAGDISPANPENYPDKWDRMESLGKLGSQTAFDIYNKIKTDENVDISIITRAVPLNREVIGYTGKEFNYKFGAGFCGMGAPACDDDFKTPQQGMKSCPFFGKEYGVFYTRISALKLGDAVIVTLPGEPNTSLREELEAGIKKDLNKDIVMTWGYSHDHLGYLLLPDDWWQSGYEAAMNWWGPKLGLYLISKAKELSKYTIEGKTDIPEDPELEKFAEFKDRQFTPTSIGISINGGKVKKQIELSSDKQNVFFSWFGGDSGIDFPTAYFEKFENDSFQPIKRKNGLLFDNSTYETFLNYSTNPTYKDDATAGEREFVWEIVWKIKHNVPAQMDPTNGKYRIKATGKYKDDKGEIKEYSIYSDEFTI